MSELKTLINKGNEEALRLLSALSARALPDARHGKKYEDVDDKAIQSLSDEIKDKLDIRHAELSRDDRSKFFSFISDEISRRILSGTNELEIEQRLIEDKGISSFSKIIRTYIYNDKSIRWIAGGAVVLIILTLIFGTNLFKDGVKSANGTLFEVFIAILNILLAFWVLYRSNTIKFENYNDKKSAAALSFKQILMGWNLLWITWILLYVFLALQWSPFFPDSKNAFKIISDIINVVNGSFFYYIFFVLDQPSVNVEGQPKRSKGFRLSYGIVLAIGAVLLAILFTLRSNSPSVEQLCPAYIAVGMAFLFGRLDSHYLTLPRIVLAPLYFYAILQLYWGGPSFNDPSPNPERIAIFGLALALKFLLYYVVYKLLKSYGLRAYLVTVDKEYNKRNFIISS